MSPIRLTFVINHAAFFVSHRLPIALRARVLGHDVRLITGLASSAEMEAPAERILAAERLQHNRVGFAGSSVNPVTELRGLIQLVRAMRRNRPDVVHCASPKGMLYGGIAARLLRVPALVLAISGMGYAFSNGEKTSLKLRAIRTVYRGLARFAFGHPNKRVVVQNGKDAEFAVRDGFARPEEVELIPGSGVDLRDFEGMSPEAKRPVVLLSARMVADKGIPEFVDAARRVRAEEPGWKFVLAGAADYQNPTSVPRAQLEAWNAEGVVEWHGHVEDMVPLYRDAAIFCLPSSYGEGMPKVLLEAAAAACATVTTHTAGCKEAIVDATTGDLVPAGDSEQLSRILLALIRDSERRIRYGHAGQAMARERFSIETVIETHLKIYHDLLENTRKPR